MKWDKMQEGKQPSRRLSPSQMIIRLKARISLRRKRRLSPSRIIILGFAAAILIGSLLLMLPISARNGRGADFADALFTAVSAVCVTGLVVQDTASYWSVFGQSVILLMIQIGGMGVVTVAAAISAASGRKISLRQRSTIQEAVSAPKMDGIVRLTGFIVKMTAIFEIAGAAVMAPAFCREFGLVKGIWYAVFHSVSAFCNAGFDLMGCREPYSSLTYFVSEPSVNIAVMTLIIVGGMGFTTWDDVKAHKYHIRKYRMQSKVVLTAAIFLISLPACWFFFFEFSQEPLGERVLSSLFQSVTTRTAGFNTAEPTRLSGNGTAVMIFLMLVGGAPGSTAGGMKTTTLAVMVSTAVSVFRRREHTRFFGRRIGEDVVRSAAAVFTLYLTLFLSGGFVISCIERLPLSVCLFETASAMGTVGLTLGITPELGLISRGILIFLMYIGRIGGLTLIFAASPGSQTGANTGRLPQEKLTVG